MGTMRRLLFLHRQPEAGAHAEGSIHEQIRHPLMVCTHLGTCLLWRVNGYRRAMLAESSPCGRVIQKLMFARPFLSLPMSQSETKPPDPAFEYYQPLLWLYMHAQYQLYLPQQQRLFLSFFFFKHICFPIFPIRFPGYTRNIKKQE